MKNALFMIFAGLAALASGCSNYTIEGRAVMGELPMVTFVAPDDSSVIYGQPVSDAVIQIYRDPDRLNRREVARTRSGSDGWFTLPVHKFGAGWMDEEWEIKAQTGARYVRDRVRLSGKRKLVMLIILAPGQPARGEDEDLMEEIERYR